MLKDWNDVVREQQSQPAERERAAPYEQDQVQRDLARGYER